MGLAADARAASTSPWFFRSRGCDGLARSAVSRSFRSGKVGVGFQLTSELDRRLGCVLLALRDNADEIADLHDGDETWNVPHRGFVDVDQAGADERADVDAGIGRADDAAVQHAGDADVVDIGELARRLWPEGRRAAPIDRRSDGSQQASQRCRRRARGESCRPRSVRRRKRCGCPCRGSGRPRSSVLRPAARDVRPRARSGNAAPAPRPCAAAPP